MKLERVVPEIRRVIRFLPRLNVANPITRGAGRVGAALLPAAKIRGVEIRNVHEGNLKFRLYLPEKRGGAALVWMHGGGMVVGSPMQTEQLCARMARRLGIVIVSVDYRLAPEHPYPAPLDDCEAVWHHLQDKAKEYGIDRRRVAVGGESAGGALAASLAQRLRDKKTQQPVAQWLIYPMLDDRTAARQELDETDHFVWNNQSNRFGWASYLGVEPGSAKVPKAAVPARRKSLKGLPPAWIGVGTLDLFFGENVEYHERLLAAGVRSTLDVVQGVPHGFLTLGRLTRVERTFIGRARNWLAKVLGAQFVAED